MTGGRQVRKHPTAENFRAEAPSGTGIFAIQFGQGFAFILKELGCHSMKCFAIIMKFHTNSVFITKHL